MAVGNCNCVRIGTFDPEVDDVDEPPAQRERRQRDLVEQPTHPNIQSNPQMPRPNSQLAEFSEYIMPLRMNGQDGTADGMNTHSKPRLNPQMPSPSGEYPGYSPYNWPLRTSTNPQLNPTVPVDYGFSDLVVPPRTNSRDGIAGLSYGFPVQGGMQSQRHGFDSSSNDPATAAARPSRPVEDTQVPHQEQSQTAAPSQFPVSAQDDGTPQQGPSNSNTYPHPRIIPVQPIAAHLQPQFLPHSSPYVAYQAVPNGNNAQEHRPFTSSGSSRPPDNSQYSLSPTYPTISQRRYFDDVGHIYPERRDPYHMYNPREAQPGEVNRLTSLDNCSCGPGCNCVFCRQHPYNPATLERVRHLSQIVELDNYEIENPRINSPMTRPQSGIWGAHTNGTLTNHTLTSGPPTNGTNGAIRNGTNGSLTNDTNGEQTGQTYQQLEGGFLGSSPLDLVNLRDQRPTFHSTLAEGQDLNDASQSNEFHSRTMRTSDYYTIEYPVDLNCPNNPGTCPCPAHSWARSLKH